ncbi:Uma2 family endonuclease [Streptomyces sp. ISL-44]|uniref:Uma2 family endonuclease n=1 Tax=Streptomyces sp. ISL-44 TaxID=2819184 RepID=UPI001BE83064|nr:Uma2 family endonuclease [Streptomyces sp. ISL-44]MBT2545086.1 Uma2 family endonuclease [Streptomyces sp. ISL-44]
MIEQPTPIDPRVGGQGFDDLLRTVEELDTPDGFKAELIRGKIVVSPWSKLRYLRPMRALRRQLEEYAPEGHIADSTPFLFSFPAVERAYGPDLFVVEEAAFDADGRHADAEALSLVAEFTSTSTKDADWHEKLNVYGQLVPVCLVVDMQDREITCFSDPSSGGYRARWAASFGKPLKVPGPFDCEIDTTAF